MEIDLAGATTASRAGHKDLRTAMCVIGGGIAGLLLADALAAAGQEVLLLEGGGLHPEPAMQQLAADVAFPDQVHMGSRVGRTWALGGSSLTWGGQLLPLPDDAGWPIAAAELRRYERRAEQLLGVDGLPYDARAFWTERALPEAALPPTLPGIEPVVSKFAPFARRNLARSLGKRLRDHGQARVASHGRAVRLLWNDAGTRVRAVEVRLPSGQQLEVETGACVLAAGTVETCRLLLASITGTAVASCPWAREVGKNFHDHLTAQVAVVSGQARAAVLATARPWIEGGVRGTAHVLKLLPTAGLRATLQLPPAMAHWTFLEPAGTGVGALRELLRGRQAGEGRSGSAWRAPGMLRDTVRLLLEAERGGRRFVSERAEVALRINMAQTTPSSSSVELSPERDATGQQKARVHWRVGERDLRHLRILADHLRETLAAAGLGEADGMTWRTEFLHTEAFSAIQGSLPPEIDDARHAMGGAAMGTDPGRSVVDPSLRVHGISNLYLASAAVFPDGSPQLPTLTLMALTLRLAEHLRQELRK